MDSSLGTLETTLDCPLESDIQVSVGTPGASPVGSRRGPLGDPSRGGSIETLTPDQPTLDRLRQLLLSRRVPLLVLLPAREGRVLTCCHCRSSVSESASGCGLHARIRLALSLAAFRLVLVRSLSHSVPNSLLGLEISIPLVLLTREVLTSLESPINKVLRSPLALRELDRLAHEPRP